VPINVNPIPGLDPAINDVRKRTADFINAEILTQESVLYANLRGYATGDEERERNRRRAIQVREEIKAKVQEAGLWAPHLPKEYGGMGLDFLALAYMYEVLAYATGGPALFGIAAPNSGNASVLVKYGTDEQKEKWLLPLIDGTYESGFSMTEPENAGSDPRSITTEAVRDGDDWVINGHKWFTSNGIDAHFFIVMCRATDPTGELGQPGQMSQIIVPTATAGVNIVRGVGIFGHANSDHCEVIYDNVRVPIENTLGQVGQGHQAAQDRLGAGRVYHCMNSVGQMWRAFDIMVERSLTRQVHGGLLKDKEFIQAFIADSYMDLQSARLLTIHAAEKVAHGDPQARTAISAIKVFVPAAFHRVADRAIQVLGAAGVSNDYPLGQMYLTARVLRIADGPDEVHRILMAKNIIHHYENEGPWDFGA
jgi:acyl-CoA dehydrogenase